MHAMNRAVRKLRLRTQLTLITLLGIAGCVGAYLAASGSNPIAAAMLVATSLCIAILLVATFFHKSYCVVHPYFSQKLSKELPRTAFNGKEIAAHLDKLDAFLHENEFQSISDFGYQQTNIKKMHHPDGLLKSLTFLLQSDSFVESELRLELTKWVDKISVARDEGALVAIHIRTVDGVSGLEIDRLSGTY